MRYTYRTDAISGAIDANDENSALAQLVAEREWAAVDSTREQRDIADGAWLTIFNADGLPVLRRGTMP